MTTSNAAVFVLMSYYMGLSIRCYYAVVHFVNFAVRGIISEDVYVLIIQLFRVDGMFVKHAMKANLITGRNEQEY